MSNDGSGVQVKWPRETITGVASLELLGKKQRASGRSSGLHTRVLGRRNNRLLISLSLRGKYRVLDFQVPSFSSLIEESKSP